ncbi:hypothetical protein [Comamonas odontotermitis]|uniref:hypothetical protein n=1 Tax=Comamonas odontotermitis TaxID=379895 RepID=UPI001CC7E2B6|nr:hypothetical protein [Comamonas odontotermitis]UBB16772.1 hypothetical protein LAD35_18585 [Comamonas odontotermitis]
MTKGKYQGQLSHICKSSKLIGSKNETMRLQFGDLSAFIPKLNFIPSLNKTLSRKDAQRAIRQAM